MWEQQYRNTRWNTWRRQVTKQNTDKHWAIRLWEPIMLLFCMSFVMIFLSELYRWTLKLLSCSVMNNRKKTFATIPFYWNTDALMIRISFGFIWFLGITRPLIWVLKSLFRRFIRKTLFGLFFSLFRTTKAQK